MTLGNNEVIIDGQIREIDHFIEHSDTYIQPSKTKYAPWYEPGKILAIREGTRPQLRFIDLIGTAENPIIIVNKGKSVIESDMSYGLSLLGGKHVRIIGNGDTDISDKQGIHIAKTAAGAPGVDFKSRSEYIEISYVEISGVGFCGIMAKTDGAIGWTMHDIHIHHCFVHDTHGEGMYIGETKTPSHELKNVKIHNNLILRSGWDLWQIANATEDVEVYNNTMWDGGLMNEPPQHKGLQIGNWNTGNYYNNVVGKTRGNTQINMGSYDINIYNSYFDGDDVITEPSVFIDNRSMSTAGSNITYSNNWFRNFKNSVFQIYNSVNKININDNKWDPNDSDAVFVTYGSGAGENNVSFENNTETTVPAIEFVDSDNDDYRIVPGSYYADKGLGYADEDDTTPPPVETLPIPSNLAIYDLSTNSLSLAWSNTSGSRTATDYSVKIERSLSSDSEFIEIHNSAEPITSYTDTNLAASTTYYYKVKNYTSSSSSSYSNIAYDTTLNDVIPPTVPNAPNALSALGTSNTQMSLIWIDNSDNEDQFIVERSVTETSGFVPVTTVGANVITVTDVGLIKNSKYYYRVKAVNVVGSSTYSNVASGITLDDSTGNNTIYSVKFIYGANRVYKGDVKGLVGQVDLEKNDIIVNDKVITNVEYISAHTSLTDAQNTATIQKSQNPDKYVWINPDVTETILVEI